jgi:hypothetical protein
MYSIGYTTNVCVIIDLEVLTEKTMKVTVYWDMSLYNLIDIYLYC